MLKNYLEMMNMTLEDMKDYIYEIDDHYLSDDLEQCFLVKQFRMMVEERHDEFVAKAILALMKAKGFSAIEHHLIMINYFFGDDARVITCKRAIKRLVLSLDDPLNEYRLLRHIMDLDHASLIRALVDGHHMNKEQAAFCNLVEDDDEEAYDYLISLDHEPSQSLLAYYSSYSLMGYLALKRHYRQTTRLALSFN